jgi:excinuclease ABC subunit A
VDAYSYNTGEKMVSYSDEQIKTLIVEITGKRITILAPVIRARKDIMENCSNKSQSKVFKSSCEWPVLDITAGMKLDRYKTHDIEIVVDRMIENTPDNEKLSESITPPCIMEKMY